MGGLLHLVQREGDWAGPQPTQNNPRCAKCNAHPSTADVPITVRLLLYNSPLLCGINNLCQSRPAKKTASRSSLNILLNFCNQLVCLTVADVVVNSNASGSSAASKMDSQQLTKVAIMVNMALFLFVLLAVTSPVAGGSGRYYDDVFPAVERRGGNPACRRCALNRW